MMIVLFFRGDLSFSLEDSLSCRIATSATGSDPFNTNSSAGGSSMEFINNKEMFQGAEHGADACNPSTRATEAGGAQVHSQPGLHSKFRARMGYIRRLCLKKEKTKKGEAA